MGPILPAGMGARVRPLALLVSSVLTGALNKSKK